MRDVRTVYNLCQGNPPLTYQLSEYSVTCHVTKKTFTYVPIQVGKINREYGLRASPQTIRKNPLAPRVPVTSLNLMINYNCSI